MLKLVSNLADTCNRVSARTELLRGDPGQSDKTHALSLGVKDAYLLHTDSIDSGCGYHALCKECKDDCRVPLVQDYFFEVTNSPRTHTSRCLST